ncbi:MAG: adenosylcobalamin-dependent ribonucleoside-diphosphate reductase [Nitrospirae bacterium]|nr:adenosylcobalamin-dependent ribonucleoside-diphosphate reductase [Nitrospirota bacterium]MCL5236431.1 adenosylcobalamin-dependent ribonucleoside-diphosphate reductase [Nitrospirota bacterium]
MELAENALKVLKARYLLRDEKGAVRETPEEMFRRVARSVGAAERLYNDDALYWEEKFYDLMVSLRFLPNSPTLMNAGKALGQLAACFVLPVDDSMESIFDTLKNAALILQSGGGTGFSFSHLRPRNDIVRSTGGVASGPVSFIRIYNTSTEVIKQGGARRGANMGMLRVDHPDILEFIKIKRDSGELANFNISVSITDAFMEALRKGEEYNLINPRSGGVAGRLRAEAVFDEIVESAWETGDPGLIFIDRINRANPTPDMGRFESTNPCGEQPLLPYEACVLGSLNLSKYVKQDDTGKAVIEYEALRNDAQAAARFLDDSIDVNIYPLPEIERMHKGNRKIGLGVMGWADMLILLGIPYNSTGAFEMARKMMKFIRDSAREASVELAGKRGVFPNFKGSVYDAPGMPRVRNATTTTVAPTGTISTIADCSSGIEPLFAVAYKRLVLDTELYEVNKYFVGIAQDRGFYSDEVMKKVFKTGNLKGIKEVPADVRNLFKTALEIPCEDHIEMQVAFQEYTDNAVSKTINLPKSAKKEDVARAYLLAYEKGAKGITVFRYGAKRGTLVKIADAD